MLKSYVELMLNPNEKIIIPKNELVSLYHEKSMSTSDIARIYNCNPETVRRRMIEQNVKRRKLHERKYNISEQELDKLYNINRISTIEIAKKYGCSQWTIWDLMRKYNLKRRAANDYHKWKEVANLIKPNFNDLQTISYVVGTILGDGWTYRNKYTYFIGLEVKDKLFCGEFQNALIKLNLNAKISYSKNKTWRTIATSKLFYNWFNSLTLQDIKNIAIKYTIEFLKGFYESEGSLFISKNKKGKYVYYYPYLVIANTNKDLIYLTAYLLFNLGFNPRINLRKPRIKRYRPIWALTISKKENIKKFIDLVKPCIKNFETLKNHKFYKEINLKSN